MRGNEGRRLFGGAVPGSPGIRLCQFTHDGLAVELTAKGAKDYKDCKDDGLA